MTSRVTIREDGSGLILESALIGEEIQGADAYSIGQPTVFNVVPVSANALGLADAETPPPIWTFYEPDEAGRFDMMYSTGRLARRVSR